MAFIGLSKISIHLMYAIAVTVDTAIEKLQKEQKNDTNFSIYILPIYIEIFPDK